MKADKYANESFLREFSLTKNNYLKWAPLFQRAGLKPRRFFLRPDAVFFGTSEGWFRLSFVKYDKQELKWVRSILEYLEERSFQNWAAPWRKTIIWEESSYCYLIQPWVIDGDSFHPGDPASVVRIAEILADFYRLGKDYHENKGIEILRDRWSIIETQWSLELEKLNKLPGESGHEKIGKEFNELKKITITALSEALTEWKSSGINALFEHHRRTGVLGHGDLRVENIIWRGNDYYLLNWEQLAFQPKIADLASLINNVSFWEADWIIFLINEYSKIQPLWSEEYSALYALLRYPAKAIRLLSEIKGEEPHKKVIKEEVKQMAKKERCLAKIWKELGSNSRWVWGRTGYPANEAKGKISMVLSPVEAWGDYSAPVNSLIKIDTGPKLPSNIIERLTINNQNGVIGGKDANVLEGAAPRENEYPETVEFQSPNAFEETGAAEKEAQKEQAIDNIENPAAAESAKPSLPNEQIIFSKPEKPSLIKWDDFPKTFPVRK
ncbi:MAG: hypothetical protein GX075_01800 [Firmicutes bacterium]|nr:hypothetical protein [Bacillota bacterium]